MQKSLFLVVGRVSACCSKIEAIIWLPTLAKKDDVDILIQNGRILIQNRDDNRGHNETRPQRPFVLMATIVRGHRDFLRIKLNNALYKNGPKKRKVVNANCGKRVEWK